MITLTPTADTASVVLNATNPGVSIYRVQDLTATVAISGLVSATFTDATGLQAVTNSNNGTATFSFFQGAPAAGGNPLMSQQNPGLFGYDLRSAIGPSAGTGSVSVNPNATFATTAGGLKFSSVTGSVTVTATLTAVPEPSSLALCGIAGAVGLIAARGRRKRVA